MPCNIKETNLKKYGDENYGSKKAAEKTKENFKNEEFKNKIIKKRKETNLKKYGYENGNVPLMTKMNKERSPEEKQISTLKQRETYFKKTGYTHWTKNKKLLEENKQRLINKYGCYPNQLKSAIEKQKQTCLEKYGTEYYFASEDFQKNAKKKYLFLNENYDSAWEIALVIYAKDNNISLEKNPCCFEFEYENKKHRYYPDFKVNGKLVEIKGDHFFDGDKMINPYDKESDLFEAKHQCGLNNGVEFWTFKEMKPILEYVYNKYTKNFIELFKKEIKFPYPNEDLSDTSDMGLIRHFHKSIYEANVKNKKSPIDAWNDKNIIYRVALNRLKYVKSCSPQDILYGFSVSKIAPKVSVFKPKLAEEIIKKYLNNYNEIFDPFSGFSGRMLGAVNCGKNYIGQDINNKHIEEAKEIIKYKNINSAILYNKNILEDNEAEYETLFTCPPYNDKEKWNNNETIKSCDEWIDLCLKKYKCKKYVFVVDKTEKYKYNVVEEIENKGLFGNSKEKIIVIEGKNG